MANDNIEVVAWIRLRQTKKLKKQNQTINLPHKNRKLLLIKILIIIEIIKIILAIKVIVMIIIKIIKCRDRFRIPTTINKELLVTLHNGQKPVNNIKKSSPSVAVRALHTPLKRLIHNLTWWIGVDHATWIPCLEFSPTWFLKNNCSGNINQHSNFNNN